MKKITTKLSIAILFAIQLSVNAQHIQSDGRLSIHICELDADTLRNATVHAFDGVYAPFGDDGFELIFPQTIDRRLMPLRPIEMEDDHDNPFLEISNRNASIWHVEHLYIVKSDTLAGLLNRWGWGVTPCDWQHFVIQTVTFKYADADVKLSGASKYPDASGVDFFFLIDLDLRKGWNTIYTTIILNEYENRVDNHITTQRLDTVDVEPEWIFRTVEELNEEYGNVDVLPEWLRGF